MTIQLIADRANVSIATVSRIINRTGVVKEATRRKVLDVMDELNYTPPAPAKKAQSDTILVCLPDLKNPFNSLIIDGIQASAYTHHYHVLILQSKIPYLSYDDYKTILGNQNLAGVILLTSVADPKLIDDFSKQVPLVMCSEWHDRTDVSFVSIDDVHAARKAVDHLIASGRKRIAMLNSSLRHKYARHREQGYREALAAAGLVINNSWISYVPTVNYNLAMSHATHILNNTHRPDAFFATSDVYAVAIIRAAKKLGLRVPEDIAVTGFDNIELSTMTDPPITTIEQPCFEIGYQSCELLLEHIHSPQADPKQIFLDTELIVRESTSL